MGMPGGVIVRKMEIDDLNPVFLLGAGIFREKTPAVLPWNEYGLVETISEDIALSCVAARKKQVLGFLIGKTETRGKNIAVIRWLGVKNSFKNCGLEEAMISSFRESAAARNASSLITEINTEDSELMEIFKKFGFTEFKDKITMQLDLKK